MYTVTMLCAVWCSLDLSRASLASGTPALALVCVLELLIILTTYLYVYVIFMYWSCRVGGMYCSLTHGRLCIWVLLSQASAAICR